MNQTLNITVFDLVSKIIPGGTFIVGLVLISPQSLGIISILSASGAIGAVLIFPVSYTTGVVIQGKSSEWFKRRRYFEEWMTNVRKNVNVTNDEPLQTEGGNHIRRAVWTDIFRRFEIPDKFVAESSPSHDKRSIEKPLLYQIFMYPILVFLSYTTTLRKETIDDYPPLYTAEKFAFQAAESYLTTNNIGNISRFEYLYILHRSYSLLSPILFVLFLVSYILNYLEVYTPVLNSGAALVTLSALCLFATSIFFNGMLHFERVRDKKIINVYFAAVVNQE